jgi:hypothetical protein
MRFFLFVNLFLLAANVFPQTNEEKIDIIKNNLYELISNYNENKNLINNINFNNIMKAVEFLIKDVNAENMAIDNNRNIFIFSKDNVKMEITPYFRAGRHSPPNLFTYCEGRLYINNLSYYFRLYDDNHTSDDYFSINDNYYLTFDCFDRNQTGNGFFYIFKPNHYEYFIIDEYTGDEWGLETPDLRISRKIIYKYSKITGTGD